MDDSLLVTVLLVIVATLLILDIIIAITIWQILKRVKAAADKAEHFAENVGNASNIAKNFTTTAAIAKIIKATAEQFGKKG